MGEQAISMLSKVSISAIFIGLGLTISVCTAHSQFADELLININEEDAAETDIRAHVDMEDFQRTVGVSFDDWTDKLKSLSSSEMQALQRGSDEDGLEEQLIASDNQFGLLKKAAEFGKKAVKKTVESVNQVVKQGIDYFKQKATDSAKAMLEKVLSAVQWRPEQYWAHMTRFDEDFTGSPIDGNDDYAGYQKNADSATQRMLETAFSSMGHQDKCDPKRASWNEYHPTPFSEIAKNPNSPLNVSPFRFQYEADPTGYFQEPCNAVSNGFFLTSFNHKILESKGNCASTPGGHAIDCIDEDHLLQVVTAATMFGSWYFHGSGGFSLGWFLDTGGMDVQFYFMYRLILKAYVKDPKVRGLLVLPGCTKKNVPDMSDGISWVDANGERNCHLFWARQIKKLLTNTTLIMTPNDPQSLRDAQALLKGVPNMSESIAAIVFVVMRAALHKRFPYGEKIYQKVTSTLVDTLMAKASAETKEAAKQMAQALSSAKVLGFENPHDGLVHMLNIFADFMDAMFFQESGKFGPGTFGLVAEIPADAGCTLMPHATWHRKATRVINGFLQISRELNSKLKDPDEMTLFKMNGLSATGVYPALVKGVPGLAEAMSAMLNLKTLAGADLSKKDIFNARGFINFIKAKYGRGWPKTGAFVGDKWPKCECERDSIQDACARPSETPFEMPTGAPFKMPLMTDSPFEMPTKNTTLAKEASEHSNEARKFADLAQKAADEAAAAAAEAATVASQIKRFGSG